MSVSGGIKLSRKQMKKRVRVRIKKLGGGKKHQDIRRELKKRKDSAQRTTEGILEDILSYPH